MWGKELINKNNNLPVKLEEIFCVRNRCYAGEGREEGDGVFDVTVCQFGAPIILSWPHFLGADQKYRDAVEGLNPEKVQKN